ncbi:MAG: hypothetical protein ACR2NR_00395 [Solirubrobacteraceae bacterium]
MPSIATWPVIGASIPIDAVHLPPAPPAAADELALVLALLLLLLLLLPQPAAISAVSANTAKDKRPFMVLTLLWSSL